MFNPYYLLAGSSVVFRHGTVLSEGIERPAMRTSLLETENIAISDNVRSLFASFLFRLINFPLDY